jgi:hypothetical protein
MASKYKYYFDRFWNAFMTDEQNNVSFYKELINPLQIVDTPEDADVIFSYASKPLLLPNKVTAVYFGEPHHTYDTSGCHIVFGGVPEFKDSRAVFIPTFLSYLYCNNFLPRLIPRQIRKTVPPNFCCMLIGNTSVQERIGLFHVVNSYKQVTSCGIGANNVGWIMPIPWGRPGFFEFISQFKFVIVTENAKIDAFITEKLFHGYLASTIPIYWGSDYVTEIFNPDSMVLLKEYTPYGLHALLQEVKRIDNDDEEWLRRVNAPVFLKNDLPEYFKMKNVSKRLSTKIEEEVMKMKKNQESS